MNILCQCGCGQPAPIAKQTVRARGWVKGQPVRFISGHQFKGRKPSPVAQAKGRRTQMQRKLGMFAPGAANGGTKAKAMGVGIHHPETGRDACSAGGHTCTERAVGGHTPEVNIKAGRKTFFHRIACHAPQYKGKGQHVRWHVNRNLISPTCNWCAEL